MSRILEQSMSLSGPRAEGTKSTGTRPRSTRWIALGLLMILVGAFGAVAAQEPTETTDPIAENPTESEESTNEEQTGNDLNETVDEQDAQPTEESSLPSEQESPTPEEQESAQSSDCAQSGTNTQCNAFGTITMPSQREIKGETVQIDAVITIESVFPEHNARWILFSLRNITDDSDSPVMIGMRSFATEHGAIVTTRVEQKEASELNLWVDTLDMPTNTPITLSATIGASERGAYTLELLVMAFDRGYSPVKDNSGTAQSLYSFTLLGVNKETKGVDVENNSLLDGKKIPAFPALAGIGLLLAVAVVLRKGRSA